MAYFPNAFQKTFFVDPTGFINTGGTATKDIPAGDFAFVSPKTWASVSLANATATATPQAMLVMGSYHTNDKIGTHGGYKESVKTHGINPKYVYKFYKVPGRNAVKQVVQVGWDGVTAGTFTPFFKEGVTYNLRVDLKGSPVLRTMNRRLYQHFDAQIGTKDYCLDECSTAVPLVDPIGMMLQWKEAINNDPIYSQFIQARVYTVDGADGGSDPDEVTTAYSAYTLITDQGVIATMKAGLHLTVIYEDTNFNKNSFSVHDHDEQEPIFILASLVDEESKPTTVNQLTFTEKTAPVLAQGTDHATLKELIMTARYRQEHWKDDNRYQEILGQDDSIKDLITLNGEKYDSYYILHTIPRKGNPSGMHNSDQYLYRIVVPTGSTMTNFEAWMDSWLDSAGTGVQLETYA